MRKPEKRCYNCIHGSLVPEEYGSREQPPVQAYVECNHALAAEFQTSDEYALVCPVYCPTFVRECGQCKKALNAPEIEHPYWAENPWELMPVCSLECLDAAEKETADYFASETRSELYAERQQSSWEINLEDW